MPKPSTIVKKIDITAYAYQVVTAYSREGQTAHLKVWRHDGRPVVCRWDTLQAIKNEALGEDVCVVEVFPPEDCVMNEVNMRHFWAIPATEIARFIPTVK